jgi:hypothetical protein
MVILFAFLEGITIRHVNTLPDLPVPFHVAFALARRRQLLTLLTAEFYAAAMCIDSHPRAALAGLEI